MCVIWKQRNRELFVICASVPDKNWKEMKNARKEGPPEKIRYSTTNKVKVIRNEGKFKGGESTGKKKKKTNRQPTDWCLLWVVNSGHHFIKLIQVADHILYALPLSFTKTVAREYLGAESRYLSLSLSLCDISSCHSYVSITVTLEFKEKCNIDELGISLDNYKTCSIYSQCNELN